MSTATVIGSGNATPEIGAVQMIRYVARTFLQWFDEWLERAKERDPACCPECGILNYGGVHICRPERNTSARRGTLHPADMTDRERESHKARHRMLALHLEELIADFTVQRAGTLNLSELTIQELLVWARQQCDTPTLPPPGAATAVNKRLLREPASEPSERE